MFRNINAILIKIFYRFIIIPSHHINFYSILPANVDIQIKLCNIFFACKILGKFMKMI